jgi:hypothetical protein
MRRFGFLAIGAVALAAVSGCSAVQDGTALDLGQSHFRVCIPAPTDGDSASFGDTMLHNRSDETITIVEVELVDPHDLTLIDALLVELGPDESGVGIRRTSDPNFLPAKWDERRAAVGAAVGPDEKLNLVLVVASSSDETAVAEAARIVYSDSNDRRFQQNTLTTLFVTHRTCPEALGQTDRN